MSSSTNANPFDLTSQPYTPPPTLEHPDLASMVVGAGGTLQAQAKTLDTIIGPSQQGMYAPQQGETFLTLTTQPHLPSPDQDLMVRLAKKPKSLATSQVLIGLATSQFGSMIALKKTPSRHGEELSFVHDGAALALEDEQEIGEDQLPLLSKAHEEPSTTTEDSAMSGQATAFDGMIAQFQESLFAPVRPLSKQTLATKEALQSTDPEQVFQTLSELAGLSTLTATPDEIKYIQDQLHTLSQSIAQANAQEGGLACMTAPLNFQVLNGLRAILSTPYDPTIPKTPYDTALENLAQGVVTTNGEVRSSEAENNTDFQALFEGDLGDIQAELEALLRSSGLISPLPSGITQENIDRFVCALSSEMVQARDGQRGRDLQSVDPETLLVALQALLQGSGLPMTSVFFEKLVHSLSISLSEVNTRQMQAWVFSSDPGKVQQALEELSGLRQSHLPQEEHRVVQNYLQVLTQTLVLLAQVRALIAQLDGMMSDATSKAKMTNVANQLKLSSDMLTNKLQAAQKQYEANTSAIRTSEILRILMPVIAVVTAIVSLLISIGSFGSATGAAAVLLVAAIVACTVTLIVEVADLVSECVTGKSVWEHIFTAAGITDETIKAVIQTVVMAGVALCGLLAGIGAAAVKIIQSIIKEGLKQGLKEAFKKIATILKEALANTMGKAALLSLVSTTMSAPIIPEGIKKLMMACGMKKEDAELWSMVIVMIINLLPMVLMLGTNVSAIIKDVKTQVKKLADSITETIKELIQKIKGASVSAEQAAKTTAAAAGEVGQVAGAVQGVSAVTDVSLNVVEAVEKPLTLTEKAIKAVRKFLEVSQTLSTLLQMISQLIKGVSSLQMVQTKKDIAAITLASATLEASLEEVTRLREVGVDAFIKMIGEAEIKMQKEWESTCKQIDEVIKSAEKFTTKLHSKGAS